MTSCTKLWAQQLKLSQVMLYEIACAKVTSLILHMSAKNHVIELRMEGG